MYRTFRNNSITIPTIQKCQNIQKRNMFWWHNISVSLRSYACAYDLAYDGYERLISNLELKGRGKKEKRQRERQREREREWQRQIDRDRPRERENPHSLQCFGRVNACGSALTSTAVLKQALWWLIDRQSFWLPLPLKESASSSHCVPFPCPPYNCHLPSRYRPVIKSLPMLNGNGEKWQLSRSSCGPTTRT